MIGASGTGKSHRASLLAYQHNIQYILDDGLLIKGNRVLAGRSAKRERTRFGAVKRALLSDPEHARQIREKLAEVKPANLLLLATSRRMSQAVAQKLELPQPKYYIAIEEISTPEAIETALKIREQENRHVVPLPTFAIKKDFPGYLIDPMRSIFGRRHARHKQFAVERSIVRPIYSSLGNFFISEHVVGELTTYIAGKIPGIYKATKVEVNSLQNNNIILNIELILTTEPDLLPVLLETQQTIKEQIEHQTGFYLSEVNLVARRLHLGAAKMEKEPPLTTGNDRIKRSPSLSAFSKAGASCSLPPDKKDGSA